MSEKRFTIDKINRIYENGDIMSKTTVVAMLNFLSEENEQLKKRNKFLEDFDSRFKEQVEAIIKKNEQLKEENEQLRQTIIEMRQDEQLYAREIVKLNKEVKDNQFLRLGNDY